MSYALCPPSLSLSLSPLPWHLLTHSHVLLISHVPPPSRYRSHSLTYRVSFGEISAIQKIFQNYYLFTFLFPLLIILFFLFFVLFSLFLQFSFDAIWELFRQILNRVDLEELNMPIFCHLM